MIGNPNTRTTSQAVIPIPQTIPTPFRPRRGRGGDERTWELLRRIPKHIVRILKPDHYKLETSLTLLSLIIAREYHFNSTQESVDDYLDPDHSEEEVLEWDTHTQAHRHPTRAHPRTGVS